MNNKRKNKFLITAVFACLLLSTTLSGCSDNSAGNYVGEQIATIKKEDTQNFSALLDEGIEKSNALYVVQFPEDLKDPYIKFLQSALSSVSFEASAAKKKDSTHYTVDLTFAPINIKKTVADSNEKYADTMEKPDLGTNVKELLKVDETVLKDSPIYEPETYMTIEVTKKGDDFSISEDTKNKLVAAALKEYMAPYDTICDLFNARDFLQAYLDATCKGDFTQFMLHTQKSPEEAQEWYNSTFADAPAELSEGQKNRYQEALKNIVKQCRYTVGIPTKNSGIFDYTIDVTYAPNNSIMQAMQEFQSGTYYSIQEAAEGAVSQLETYAAAPAFGPEETKSISLNLTALLKSGEADSELSSLVNSICPSPV